MSPRHLFIGSLVACTVGVSLASAQELTEAPPFIPPTDAADAPVEKSVLKADAPPAETLPVPQPSERASSVGESSSDDERGELLRLVRKNHPWARFEPGAWRRVVTVSEVFDETGAFARRTLTERTERLVTLGEREYTLSIEPVVQIAGRRAPGPVEARKLWLLNDRSTEEPIVGWTAGEPTSISLGDTVFPCRTWTIDSAAYESDTPPREEKLTLYLAAEHRPAILRRERRSLLQGDPGAKVTQRVTRAGMPALYGDELILAWDAETMTEHPTGERTEAFATHSEDVPGGLLQKASTEYDASGAKMRWQVTRLVASGRTPSEDIGSPKPQSGPPSISIEVRPRRLLRLLRRGEEADDETVEQGL